MSDLLRELNHARAMAAPASHRPDCTGHAEGPPDGAGDIAFEWTRPPCPGCVTDTDRLLWAQLADEYQTQLDRHREDTLL